MARHKVTARLNATLVSKTENLGFESAPFFKFVPIKAPQDSGDLYPVQYQKFDKPQLNARLYSGLNSSNIDERLSGGSCSYLEFCQDQARKWSITFFLA